MDAIEQKDLAPFAEAYASTHGGLAIPIGFDSPVFRSTLVSLLRQAADSPEEVWAVAGSGCLVRARP